MSLKELAFSYPEEVAGKPYSVATFCVSVNGKDSIDDRAAGLAIGQTIGTWTEVPGVTEAMLQENMGRVVGAYEVPPAELTSQLSMDTRTFVVQIAFPEVNFGAVIPMLLTTLLGNDVSTSAQVKLLDIHMSRGLAEGFGGPRYGLQGIRELAGVPERPLILNVLKPCTGFPPEAAVAWFEESARAGSDVIKDDELLADPSFNRLERRVSLFHAAAKRVYEETGHRTLFCANITGLPDQILTNARRAKELGADLVMVNAVAAGIGVLQSLRRMDDFTLPILAHFAGFATMTESLSGGIASPLLLGKLLRVAGADAVSFPSPFSAYPLLQEQFIRIARNMRMHLYDLKPALPVPGGGIHPITAVKIVQVLGPDVMLTVGGAIQGHPGGASAGVWAMRSALDAAQRSIPLSEAAQTIPELKVALEVWGK